MSPSEATEVYESLIAMLKQLGLVWVVEQVSQEAASGRTITKTVSLQGEELTPTGRRRRQRVEFASTMPYSPQERLHLLLNAVEHAVVGTLEMRRTTFEVLSATGAPSEVKFVSETPPVEGHSYRRSDVETQARTVEHLRGLLKELREELSRAD